MIKLKDILQEKTYKTTISTSSNWIVYNMSDALKIKPIKVVKSKEEALKWKTKYQRHDKWGAYGMAPVKHWNKYVVEGVWETVAKNERPAWVSPIVEAIEK